ncbi:hypothetical protein CC1G_13749 [Coprinopsis cinerea okayama7|uniref:Uncharacterized protein n=1 Tax=Coprinopsis cinerea (strain Okayama-7 / 130 / ATCC MYA-4618 / FGSC 9003) TaxID=240176 RepID=D6RK77_COPC7|nr:hypothetical protein CC1G_13749 [Coprinopsis cinerea okayama7\|eukprot:XP_002912217.1 hypothetical protein CC1G_13749 [Coprinopsis cinerea okayama7\
MSRSRIVTCKNGLQLWKGSPLGPAALSTTSTKLNLEKSIAAAMTSSVHQLPFTQAPSSALQSPFTQMPSSMGQYLFNQLPFTLAQTAASAHQHPFTQPPPFTQPHIRLPDPPLSQPVPLTSLVSVHPGQLSRGSPKAAISFDSTPSEIRDDIPVLYISKLSAILVVFRCIWSFCSL